jgi:hypothetical protein
MARHLALLERRFSTLLALDRLDHMPSTLSVPAASEFAPFYQGYVARVAGVPDPVGELSRQRDRARDLLSAIPEARGAFRYAPGKWSVKQLVGHLGDAERILPCRLLRVARGDQAPLPGWDENAYAETAGFDERTLRDLIDDWTAARDATIALVRGVPGDAWARSGIANHSPVTARALLYIVLGHVEHHLQVLNERYTIG